MNTRNNKKQNRTKRPMKKSGTKKNKKRNYTKKISGGHLIGFDYEYRGDPQLRNTNMLFVPYGALEPYIVNNKPILMNTHVLKHLDSFDDEYTQEPRRTYSEYALEKYNQLFFPNQSSINSKNIGGVMTNMGKEPFMSGAIGNKSHVSILRSMVISLIEKYFGAEKIFDAVKQLVKNKGGTADYVHNGYEVNIIKGNDYKFTASISPTIKVALIASDKGRDGVTINMLAKKYKYAYGPNGIGDLIHGVSLKADTSLQYNGRTIAEKNIDDIHVVDSPIEMYNKEDIVLKCDIISGGQNLNFYENNDPTKPRVQAYGRMIVYYNDFVNDKDKGVVTYYIDKPKKTIKHKFDRTGNVQIIFAFFKYNGEIAQLHYDIKVNEGMRPKVIKIDAGTESGNKDTKLEDTPLKGTTLKGTMLESTALEDTPLKDTTLKGTALEDTPLKDTPLKGTTLEDTPLKDTPISSVSMPSAVCSKQGGNRVCTPNFTMDDLNKDPMIKDHFNKDKNSRKKFAIMIYLLFTDPTFNSHEKTEPFKQNGNDLKTISSAIINSLPIVNPTIKPLDGIKKDDYPTVIFVEKYINKSTGTKADVDFFYNTVERYRNSE
jgi:hypothetical protein